MELNKTTTKRLLLIITFGLLLYWVLTHPDKAVQIFSWIFSILSPFLLGFCIAFFINVLLRPVEHLWHKIWRRRYRPIHEKAKRPVCLLISTCIVLGAFFALFFIIAPSLKESITTFVRMLPHYLLSVQDWLDHVIQFLSQYDIKLPEYNLDVFSIQDALLHFFTTYGNTFLNKTISLFSVAVNLVLAFVFSLYLLAQKEHLCHQAGKVIDAVFSEKKAKKIREIASLTNTTFTHFVTGQLTEALILGSLCFVGMSLFQMPYAPVISVLVGFSALIPIFGAIIGALFGAFLILLVSPSQAFWFLVFLVILQQLEGNLIYPRVVGKSVGLPGIWVLAAVTIGGSAFGLVGMILCVPLCSVLYTLARQAVRNKLKKKGLPSS